MFDGLGDEWSSVAAELMICVVSCGEDLCAGSIDSCGSELAREGNHTAARDIFGWPGLFVSKLAPTGNHRSHIELVRPIHRAFGVATLSRR